LWPEPLGFYLANAGNIRVEEYQGRDKAVQKLGKGVGPGMKGSVFEDGGDPLPEHAHGGAVAVVDAPPSLDGELQEVPAAKLGSAFVQEATGDANVTTTDKGEIPTPPGQQSPEAIANAAAVLEHEDYQGKLQKLTEFGPKAREGNAAAAAILNGVAEDEYAREVPRAGVVRRLAAYGFGRPGAGAT